jgi:hypothetical protein
MSIFDKGIRSINHILLLPLEFIFHLLCHLSCLGS